MHIMLPVGLQNQYSLLAKTQGPPAAMPTSYPSFLFLPPPPPLLLSSSESLLGFPLVLDAWRSPSSMIIFALCGILSEHSLLKALSLN